MSTTSDDDLDSRWNAIENWGNESNKIKFNQSEVFSLIENFRIIKSFCLLEKWKIV